MTDSYNQSNVNLAAANLANTAFEFTVGPEGSGARFNTIQAAIDAALADGASLQNPKLIVVLPGDYPENITAVVGVVISALAPIGTAMQGTLTIDLPDAGGFENTATAWNSIAIEAPAGQSAIVFTGTTAQIGLIQNSALSSVDTPTIINNNTGVDGPNSSTLLLQQSDVTVTDIGISGVSHSAGTMLYESSGIQAGDDNTIVVDVSGGALELHISSRFVGRLSIPTGTVLLDRCTIQAGTVSAIDIGAPSACLALLPIINSQSSPAISGTGALLFSTITYQASGSGLDAGLAAAIALGVENASNNLYAAIAANWAGAPPTNVQDAVSRIATALFGLVGPIP